MEKTLTRLFRIENKRRQFGTLVFTSDTTEIFPSLLFTFFDRFKKTAMIIFD
jgi:hypothetical protein